MARIPISSSEFTQLSEDIACYHQIFQQGYDKIILAEIDPLVEPEDPSAFPLKLAFNTRIMGWKGRSPFYGELGANQLSRCTQIEATGTENRCIFNQTIMDHPLAVSEAMPQAYRRVKQSHSPAVLL